MREDVTRETVIRKIDSPINKLSRDEFGYLAGFLQFTDLLNLRVDKHMKGMLVGCYTNNLYGYIQSETGLNRGELNDMFNDNGCTLFSDTLPNIDRATNCNVITLYVPRGYLQQVCDILAPRAYTMYRVQLEPKLGFRICMIEFTEKYGIGQLRFDARGVCIDGAQDVLFRHTMHVSNKLNQRVSKIIGSRSVSSWMVGAIAHIHLYGLRAIDAEPRTTKLLSLYLEVPFRLTSSSTDVRIIIAIAEPMVDHNRATHQFRTAVDWKLSGVKILVHQLGCAFASIDRISSGYDPEVNTYSSMADIYNKLSHCDYFYYASDGSDLYADDFANISSILGRNTDAVIIKRTCLPGGYITYVPKARIV